MTTTTQTTKPHLPHQPTNQPTTTTKISDHKPVMAVLELQVESTTADQATLARQAAEEKAQLEAARDEQASQRIRAYRAAGGGGKKRW